MHKHLPFFFLTLSLVMLITSCNRQGSQASTETLAAGKLFIIGGGKRPASLMNQMFREAGISSSDYILVFPMSSEIPDTSFMNVRKQFEEAGFERIYNFDYQSPASISEERLDSIRNARLIYFPGGSQVRFMESISNSPLPKAFMDAYRNGAMLAGTSAGAAIMSKKMITGDQMRHPEYSGDFPSIESENILITEGLGLIETAIIDQHFIRRQRLNRLIATVLENPGETGIGIDESTAICVQGDSATVYGLGQVILLRHQSDTTRVWNGLLGARNLQMDVLLPGEKFSVK